MFCSSSPRCDHPYHYDFRLNGRRYRASTETSDKHKARDIEARLSDALHQRLTERFVNRRTAVLMKSMGKDAALLKVELGEDGTVLVEGEAIGRLRAAVSGNLPVAGPVFAPPLLAAELESLARCLAHDGAAAGVPRPEPAGG